MKKYLIGVGIGLIAMFLILKSCENDPEVIKVPVKIEVPVPVIEKEFDTIEKPVPIYVDGPTVIDSTFYKEYKELKDQRKKDSLFREAITIKEYRETIEDDTIKIDLYAKVRGDLLKYQLGYETKPYTIPLDTTLKVAIPKKAEFYGGPLINVSPDNDRVDTGAGAQLLLVNKRHTAAYNVGYDFINKQATFGALIKF